MLITLYSLQELLYLEILYLFIMERLTHKLHVPLEFIRIIGRIVDLYSER